ncbi:MAG: hypothetical protein LWX56_08230 [Ignavibacteria bacterium]|nr:hypothetical protein [Ignavibacteria bacterium]
MKAVFIIYHDVLETRLTHILTQLQIDYFTKWEGVKGKGHNTDAHLGSRTFPGLNSVLLVAFEEEQSLNKLIAALEEVNKEALREDDHIRLFQIPLERVI